MPSYVSCQYCGRFHLRTEAENCPAKIAHRAEVTRMQNDRRRRKRAGNYADRFRDSVQWQEMSKRVRSRDNYLCLCCAANLMGTDKQIHSDLEGDVQVHHVVPVSEDKDKRLDETNLITVCAVHHQLCEQGKITRQQQIDLIQESIRKAHEGRIDVM